MAREGYDIETIEDEDSQDNETPSTSQTVRQSYRPRNGRRAKRKRLEEDEASTASESEEEEVEEGSQPQSSVDDDDPDWRSGMDSNHHRPRRSSRRLNQSYNVKDLMKSEVVKSNPAGRGRGRPKKNTNYNFNVKDASTSKADMAEINLFVKKLPIPTNAFPPLEARRFSTQIDDTEAVVNASGGFRHFVKSLTDITFLDIFNYTETRYEFPPKVNDAMQLAQCLRHMWNKLPYGTRVHWERAARAKAKEDFEKKKINDDEIMEIDENNQEGISADFKRDEEDDYPTMPVTEIPFKGAAKYDNNVVILTCCPDTTPMTSFIEVKKHFLTKHYTAYFYSCHFCNALHESKEDLTKHTCQEFSQYMISTMVTGKMNMDMKCAYLFITCYECAFWLPIRDNFKGDRLEQIWSFFAMFNRNHSGKSLNLVVIFTLQPLKETMSINEAFSATVIPNILRDIPLGCSDCRIEEFEHLMDIDAHMAEHLDLRCSRPNCQEKFGTEAHLKYHTISHLPHFSKFLFARHLKDKVTVYPPVHVKNALPRIGFANCGTAYGGRTFDGEENLFEFTDSDELFIDEKINNAVNHSGRFNNSDDEGFTPRQARFDMGLEKKEQYLVPSKEQSETVTFLNRIFAKQMNPKNGLDWNCHIWKDAKKDIFCEEMETPDGEKVIVPKEISFSSGSPLCKEMVTFFSTKVPLPVQACFEIVSEAMHNSSYDLCTSCSVIFELEGTFIHTCAQDKVVPIHRWESGLAARIKCHLCDETTCTIYSLRGHLALEHNLYVIMHQTKAHIAKNNLMKKAIASMLKGARSAVARKTDAAMMMEETLGVLSLKGSTPKQISIVQPTNSRNNTSRRVTHNISTYPIQGNGSQSLQNFTSRSFSRSPLQKPYIEESTRPLTLVCIFCQFRCSDLRKMREHLRMKHIELCRGCGHAFARVEAKKKHEISCTMRFSHYSVMYLEGHCTVCKMSGSLPSIYTHIFECHMSLVAYGREDERLFRKDNGTFFIKGIVVKVNQAPQTQNFPLANGANILSRNQQGILYKNPKNTCYLCGVSYSSPQILRMHLALHPEKWKYCPFCPGTPVRSHEDLRVHLLSTHYELANSSQMICRKCRQTVDREDISHAIYSCPMYLRCVFCSETDYEMSTLSDIRKHWLYNHQKIFKRFGCSACKDTFPNIIKANTHICKLLSLEHECECGIISTNRSEYVDHFYDNHFDKANQVCLLCQTHINGQKDANLVSHRLKHFREKRVPKMIVQLDEDLFPKHQADYSSNRESLVLESPPNLTKESAEVIELDSDEESLPQPLIQQESDAFIIRSIVRKLIHNVCLLLGESTKDNALEANVRMEEDDIQIVTHHPGYVEDDETDSNSREENSHRQPVIQTFNPTDDDLCIIAEVDIGSSSATSNVTSNCRAKKHKCSQCSTSFMTKASLEAHERTSHVNDVGGICGTVYGAPLHGTFYVCRFCTALFETQIQYRKHAEQHRANSTLSCAECSGISYNVPLSNQHSMAHKKIGIQRLSYSCGTCSIRFQTDLRLYHHINTFHNIPLLFFCKWCCFCSYQVSDVVTHIQISKDNCRAELYRAPMKFDQMMGVFPSNLVHFQPLNEDIHIRRLAGKNYATIVPSECTHRSFLSPTDSVVSCKDCFCTMSAVTFQAIEDAKFGGSPASRVFYDDFVMDNPWSQELVPMGARTYRRKGSNFIKAPRIQRPTMANGVNVIYPTNGTQNLLNNYEMARGVRTNIPGMAGDRINIPSPIIAQVQKSTAPIYASTQAKNSQVLRTQPAAQRFATTVSAPQAGPSNPTNGEKCNYCSGLLDNPKVRRLHDMHLTDQKWFCFMCANPQNTEMEAVVHLLNCMSEERKRAIMANPNHKIFAFNLFCPIDECEHSQIREEKRPFTSFNDFNSHILKFHLDSLVFPSTNCDMKFCTAEARKKHQESHKRHEELGYNGPCCTLCGITNQWNVLSQIHGREMSIGHFATHAMKHYSMCRVCLMCFMNDFDGSKSMQHFEAKHAAICGHGQLKCLICSKNFRRELMKAHIEDKHLIHGYKGRYNQFGQLLVRTGGLTKMFMGLSYEGCVDDVDIK